MENNSLVSVIVPVYNTSETLTKCLDSIVGQSYKNLEIIVVNDGSTDNSIDIITEYAGKDSRIIVIDKKNGGLSSARNAGLKIATGSYVLHIDSDDWVELNMCEKLCEVAETEDADIVVSDVFFETEKTSFVRKEPYRPAENSSSFLEAFAFNKGLNSVWNKLIKLSLYQKNGILHFEDVSLGEDVSALLRLVVVAKKISHLDCPFYHYNLKSAGMSRGIKRNVVEYHTCVCKAEDFYSSNNYDTALFPLLRFKIAYSELVQCGLKKAHLLGYGDYRELAKKFMDEIPAITSHPLYGNMSFKYKFFLKLYRGYYLICNRKYK